MPTQMHPQAKFDPIPPDLDLHSLVDRTPNFDWVVRITLGQVGRLGPVGFEKLVQLHVIEGGRPLVIEGWNKVLPKEMFSAQWLESNYDKKQENVRDITNQSDIPMTTGHYLRSMRQLTNQWSPTNYRDDRRQRLYMKDIDCPEEWFNHLKRIIPPNVFYMNDNVSDNPAADSRNDDIFGTSEKATAVSGDLMSSLQEDMRAQNLMCYIGHEGTYTPAHREMCASLGQNIMVEASGDKPGEKEGISIWFMTETKDREVVREYFLSMLGHDIEIEKHFAQINAWKKANFPVYVVEQKAGDFILVPPLAPHQVWNRGTRTMKVAWNRTTVETLDLALHEALPKARLVCRDEQYKNKAIIYYTLNKYYDDLRSLEESAEVSWLGLGQELMQTSARMKQMANDFKRLFSLFTEVLVDEMFAYKEADVEFVPFDSNITCSYCRSNIFNRFLTCKCCVRQLINGDEDTYDICMECYAMGRSCVCISGLQWCEQWRWSNLVEKHEMWRAMVIQQDGFVDIETSPQPIEVCRKKSGKKSVAQICQEQLRRRPWNDITKPPGAEDEPEEPEEPEVDEEGRPKKKKPKRKKKKGDTHKCHVCCHQEYTYRLNFCTTCPNAYCYGVLWRAFDTMPQTAMQQEHWQCPRCLNICNCGSCRRTGLTTPYVPKNTLLGHDTRPVADDRSVEAIVDFRVHNLSWLKAAGEENRSKDSKRMQRLRQQADAEKAKDVMTIDAEDAPHEMDSALQDSIMNGYGDQSHLGDLADHEAGGQTRDEQEHDQEDNGEPSHAPLNGKIGGSQGQQSNHDDSSYPDPTGMNGGRMMGMGFYDQDESADKILFDAFQMPTADALRDEPQMSDFVKKTLRLAKRKARLETDDDPDFEGPKNHHRKKPKTGNLDQLINLDPALLGTLGDGKFTPTGLPAPDVLGNNPDGAAEHMAMPEGESSETTAARPRQTRLLADPLRPTLRHAKPTASYVEAEEPAFDPDETVPVRLFNAANGNDDEDINQDTVDLASNAFRALTQVSGGTDSSAPVRTPTLTASGKRRGRPPRSSLGANTVVTPASEPKRRGRPPGSGRPRRSTLDAEEREDPDEDATKADAPDDEPDEDITVDELEAQLNEELAKSDDDSWKPATTATRGRPARRRGRPPGSRSSVQSRPEPEAVKSAKDPSRMSMQERMALRGRRIRIGERRQPREGTAVTNRSTPPNSATRNSAATRSAKSANTEEQILSSQDRHHEMRDDDFVPAPAVSSSPESEVAPDPPRRSGREMGPTVVRLASSEDSDSESVTSDEEIPARKPFSAIRGRGRGRGGRVGTRGRL
ncbi:hypothetical protein F5Y15DRAFT_375134 [Xylariaceae sp. FL0016]|nr:hypothetical protein F5Y15DRAFT_375134 [Xylariaceae sp. FL0016]